MMNLMLHSLQPSHGAVTFILAQLYTGVNTLTGKMFRQHTAGVNEASFFLLNRPSGDRLEDHLSLACLIKGAGRARVIVQQGAWCEQSKLVRGRQLQGLQFRPANTVQPTDPERLLQRQALKHPDEATVGFFLKKGSFARRICRWCFVLFGPTPPDARQRVQWNVLFLVADAPGPPILTASERCLPGHLSRKITEVEADHARASGTNGFRDWWQMRIR